MRRIVRVQEGRVAPPNPFVVVWRWRYEAALLIGGPFFVSWVGWQYVVTVASLLAALVSVSPLACRYARARLMCVVTPHRVRAACAEALVVTRKGKLPMVLWTKPTRDGERLWLYCRPGITPADLAEAESVITVACWARSIRTGTSERSQAFVWLDIVR